MTNPPINNLVQQLEAIRVKMREAQERAYNSMREALFLQRHGGACQKDDPNGVLHIEVNEKGSPAEIRVESGWEHFYQPEELSAALTGVAQAIEHERDKRAQEYLERNPDAIHEITAQEIEAAFSSARGRAPGGSGDPTQVIQDINDRVPEMRREAKEFRAAQTAQTEPPVRVVVIAETLVTIRVNGDFAQEATNTKLNAEISQAIARAMEPDAESAAESLQSKLLGNSAQARAAAETILANFKMRAKKS